MVVRSAWHRVWGRGYKIIATRATPPRGIVLIRLDQGRGVILITPLRYLDHVLAVS